MDPIDFDFGKWLTTYDGSSQLAYSVAQWSKLGNFSHCLLLFTETCNIRLLKDPPYGSTLKGAQFLGLPGFLSVVLGIICFQLSEPLVCVDDTNDVGGSTPSMSAGLSTKRRYILWPKTVCSSQSNSSEHQENQETAYD